MRIINEKFHHKCEFKPLHCIQRLEDVLEQDYALPSHVRNLTTTRRDLRFAVFLEEVVQRLAQ